MNEAPTCHQCGKALDNAGAESRGDGDICDILECPDHGRVYEVHSNYCECGRGGSEINEVYDPRDIPYYGAMEQVP